jgi:glycosyltransferase involved in cell wall biosynthesis
MAYRGKDIAVVIPAYNEEKFISSVITGTPPFVDRIIVVDDGSSDRTTEHAETSDGNRVELLQHTSRKGVGSAIKSGYRAALSRRADIVAVVAGDLQMDPADLPALLDPLVDGTADYAKGNRLMMKKLYSSMPRLRRFGNCLLGLLTRVAIMRRGIKDPQCGYTAIRVPTLKALFRLPFCNGYGYPNEILCNLAILRTRIIEVPVRAVYGEEASGIWIPSYAVKMLFILTRCFFRRLAYLLGIFTV